MLSLLWSMTRGYRLRPWRSPYLLWRIETYSGQHADRITFGDFWRFTWRTGFARLEVKENGPSGRTVFDHSEGTGSHPYRPDLHLVHLGSPAGRGGLLDATMPGIIIKNLWVSSRPRPAFPGE